MRFQVILQKTHDDLMSPKRALPLILFGLLPIIIAAMALSSQFEEQGDAMSLDRQTYLVNDVFTIILFAWVSGFFLAKINICFTRFLARSPAL